MKDTHEHECWTRFDPVGRSPLVHDAPDGWTAQQWHADASADTGTSHYALGRMYVVACEWCRCTFLAPTKRDAMALFRIHEREMLTNGTSPEATNAR